MQHLVNNSLQIQTNLFVQSPQLLGCKVNSLHVCRTELQQKHGDEDQGPVDGCEADHGAAELGLELQAAWIPVWKVWGTN